jgi:hypothetical protein
MLLHKSKHHKLLHNNNQRLLKVEESLFHHSLEMLHHKVVLISHKLEVQDQMVESSRLMLNRLLLQVKQSKLQEVLHRLSQPQQLNLKIFQLLTSEESLQRDCLTPSQIFPTTMLL